MKNKKSNSNIDTQALQSMNLPGMPLDFCENNWKSTCACRLTENEPKKRQKVEKEKDEIGENRE